MQVSRIQIFGEMLSKALGELQNRDFSTLPFKDLLTLINQLEARLWRDGGVIRYTTDQHASYLGVWDEENSPIKIGLFDQK